MKFIQFYLIVITIFSCSDNSQINKIENIANIQDDNIEILSVNKEKSILIKENRELQFLYYSNGGLIGYFDDGTITGCPKCDLLDINVEFLKSKEPYSKFKLVSNIIITELGDTIPINSMTENYWSIINYKIIIPIEHFEKSSSGEIKDSEIGEIALSFHKWYITNTNLIKNEIPTSFNVLKDKNGFCKVDFNPYFKELEKLGTISEKFKENEIKRQETCIENIEKLKWEEYIKGITEECDDYMYWTQSQDFEGGVKVISIIQKEDKWEVIISLYSYIDNDIVKNWKSAIVKIEKVKDKSLIMEINWIKSK